MFGKRLYIWIVGLSNWMGIQIISQKIVGFFIKYFRNYATWYKNVCCMTNILSKFFHKNKYPHKLAKIE